jgi:hypothetical protein
MSAEQITRDARKCLKWLGLMGHEFAVIEPSDRPEDVKLYGGFRQVSESPRAKYCADELAGHPERQLWQQYARRKWRRVYLSVKQPDLIFYAEPVELHERRGFVPSWGVTSKVEGFPATEAFDDWFAHEKDAEEIARKLAAGEEIT